MLYEVITHPDEIVIAAITGIAPVHQGVPAAEEEAAIVGSVAHLLQLLAPTGIEAIPLRVGQVGIEGGT